MTFAERFLVKRALLSMEEAKALAKALPTYRKRKVKKDEEGFREQIRGALTGRKLEPEDAEMLTNARHRFWGPSLMLGWPAAVTQDYRRQHMKQMLLEEIKAMNKG